MTVLANPAEFKIDSSCSPAKKEPKKAYELKYDSSRQAMLIKIMDKDSMYPLYLEDEEAGIYKINKNTTGKLQMTK